MRRLLLSPYLLVALSALADINYLDFTGIDDNSVHTLRAGENLAYEAVDNHIDFQIFEFGVAPQRKGNGDWCVTLSSETDTISVRLKEVPNIQDIVNDSGKVILTLTDADRSVRNVDFSRGVDLENGANYMRINVLPDSTYIYIGGEKISYAAGMKFGGFFNKASVTANTPARLVRSVIASRPIGEYPLSSYQSEEEITLQLETSSDKHVAFWQFLDEDVYTDNAVKACNYTFALLPDGDSGYQIVYISGDTRRDSPWALGALKGRLIPTIIPGHYNLEWIDYHGHPMNDGLNATLEDDILTLDFPYQRAHLRFIRLPRPRD